MKFTACKYFYFVQLNFVILCLALWWNILSLVKFLNFQLVELETVLYLSTYVSFFFVLSANNDLIFLIVLLANFL